MFKFVALFCLIAVANAGILSPSLSIAAGPAIVSAPSINILRASPIAVGTSIGGISSGLISNRIVSNGLVSGGLISNGIVSGGLVSKGLVSGGLISGGLVSGGKLLI